MAQLCNSLLRNSGVWHKLPRGAHEIVRHPNVGAASVPRLRRWPRNKHQPPSTGGRTGQAPSVSAMRESVGVDWLRLVVQTRQSRHRGRSHIINCAAPTLFHSTESSFLRRWCAPTYAKLQNCETTCFAITLGPDHPPHPDDQKPRHPRLLHPRNSYPRLVPQHLGNPSPSPPGRPSSPNPCPKRCAAACPRSQKSKPNWPAKARL